MISTSFGVWSFIGGHVRITQEIYLKYTRHTTTQIPNMSKRERRPTTKQIKAQDKRRIGPKSNQANSTQRNTTMGQVPNMIGGSPTKMGWFGAGNGATATPPPALFGLEFSQLLLTTLPNIGMVVSHRFIVLGGRFGAFHEGMKHFPNDPLLSTYKRDSLLLIQQQHTREEEQIKSKSKSITTPWA